MAEFLSNLPTEILSKVLWNRRERNFLLVISSKLVVWIEFMFALDFHSPTLH